MMKNTRDDRHDQDQEEQALEIERDGERERNQEREFGGGDRRRAPRRSPRVSHSSAKK